MSGFILSVVFLPLLVGIATGQHPCGVALQDIPDPSSDTCTSFFRCFQRFKFSVRCKAGTVFDFDRAECRDPINVDCPLQLQRFQAPAVPPHLKPPRQAQQAPDIQIHVIQQSPVAGAPNLAFVDGRGNRLPVRQQANNQQSTRSLLRGQPKNVFLSQPVNQSPLLGLTQGQANGQVLAQGQGQSQFNNALPQGQLQNPNQGLGQRQIFTNQPAPQLPQGQFATNVAVSPVQGQGQNQGQGQVLGSGQANIPIFVPSSGSAGQPHPPQQ